MCRGDVPTKESDIWALGCVLYYLCTFDIPFNGNISKIQNEEHTPINSQYSQELRYFVDWCLKKERNQRPTINEIITNEFIIDKALSLGIQIPKTSAMSTYIQTFLKSEKEKNVKLESKISELNNENISQKAEIEQLKAKINSLKGIIVTNGKDIEALRLKAVEIAVFLENCKKNLNEKQLVEAKKIIRVLIADAEKIKKILNYSEQDLKDPEILQIQNTKNIITMQYLRSKKSEILKMSNNLILEEEFRKTCSAFENDSDAHDTSAIQAYQDYVSTYHQKTSLFNLIYDNDSRTNLLIYNTETEARESKVLELPEPLNWGTCIAQLPNGKLFCYGNISVSGIALLIDENYIIQELPSGIACGYSSAIFFKNKIYCFGGWNENNLTLSSRFDLGKNQWNELTPLLNPDAGCSTIIFDGSILIAGVVNKNILRYSIDNYFFRTIPYDFAEMKRKILINAERLYLIECDNGSIYESEIGSDEAWRRIANNSIIDFNLDQIYCAYNKRGIYIGSRYYKDSDRYACFKFILNEKRLTKLFDNEL